MKKLIFLLMTLLLVSSVVAGGNFFHSKDRGSDCPFTKEGKCALTGTGDCPFKNNTKFGCMAKWDGNESLFNKSRGQWNQGSFFKHGFGMKSIFRGVRDSVPFFTFKHDFNVSNSERKGCKYSE